jgi:hypothetical protein
MSVDGPGEDMRPAPCVVSVAAMWKSIGGADQIAATNASVTGCKRLAAIEPI